jgi:large subunit ribosomal protein L23
MGILKKVKDLAGLETKEEPKKPRAKKAATSSDTEEKPKAKRVSKKVAPAAAVEEHNHEDHAGHDHSHEEGSVIMHAPESVQAAIGIGAPKYILKPLVTEKGTYAAEYNTYLFAVLPHAGKLAIKQAIEKLYGVTVTKIRTMRYDGKVVRSGRIEGRRSNFKKAYVTVAKGQSITIHKGV